jgi:hypothetical protein
MTDKSRFFEVKPKTIIHTKNRKTITQIRFEAKQREDGNESTLSNSSDTSTSLDDRSTWQRTPERRSYSSEDEGTGATWGITKKQRQEEWVSNKLAKISPGLLISVASDIGFMLKKKILLVDQDSINTLKAIRSNIKKMIDYKQGQGITLQEVINPFKEVQYVVETLAQSLSETGRFTKDGGYLSNIDKLIQIYKN